MWGSTNMRHIHPSESAGQTAESTTTNTAALRIHFETTRRTGWGNNIMAIQRYMASKQARIGGDGWQ